MKFKAKIISQYYVSQIKELPVPIVFIFSKNKIYFPEELKSRLERLDFDPFQGTPLHDKTNYTLDKVYHYDTDKPVYQITFGQEIKKYIELDFINKLKLQYIHKRFWIQKEPLAMLSLIISIGTLVWQFVKEAIDLKYK